VFRKFGYLIFFSQRWFASVQDVLQADWQDVWHSPQPVFSFFSLRLPFTTVLICFISISLSACIVSRTTGENARRKPFVTKAANRLYNRCGVFCNPNYTRAFLKCMRFAFCVFTRVRDDLPKFATMMANTMPISSPMSISENSSATLPNIPSMSEKTI